MMTTTRRPLLTPGEAADYLKVSARSLARWRHETPNDPPFCRIKGCLVRYRPEDLDAWVDRQRSTPPPNVVTMRGGAR